MAVQTPDAVRTDDTRPTTRRPTAALFCAGGLLMAVGGMLHPRGSGETVDAHLLSMFDSPVWSLSHGIQLVGAVVSVLALVSAARGRAFGPRAQRWLPLAVVGWGLGAAELVPHLLAERDAHALAHHGPTPLLDLHVLLSLVAGPALGLTGALLAVAVARDAGSRAAWVLAACAVVGGVLSGAAAPLTHLTGDPAVSVLFAFQTGLAVWLVGTGVRLLRQ